MGIWSLLTYFFGALVLYAFLFAHDILRREERARNAVPSSSDKPSRSVRQAEGS